MTRHQHILGLAPGFGGFKLAEVTPEGLRTAYLPAVVGVGDTDIGLLSLGGLGRRRNGHAPRTVSWGDARYLVGPHVARYARPLQRLDFQRLAHGPELRALTYGVLGEMLGPGQHDVRLIVGLPVAIMADRERATTTLKALRKWLVGEHDFTVDDARCQVTVQQVKALAQPVGAFFAWGLDDAGRWRRTADDLKAPVGVCDIGFNTLDLFAVEGGQVIERLLAAEGKAWTEAIPIVDAKLSRDPAMGFGGARLKELHPSLAVGDYPILSLRLYEPKPVPPEQIVVWGVFPQAVMDALLQAATQRLCLMIIGGIGSGKTTLLSALAHGIRQETRIVTATDARSEATDRKRRSAAGVGAAPHRTAAGPARPSPAAGAGSGPASGLPQQPSHPAHARRRQR